MSADASSNELRILVFGQSNATGEHLADPGQAWPKLVAAELAARLKRPASVVTRPIYVHVPGVERYLDRELEKYRPDIILFGASAFAFAQKMVVVKIRRRFGDRPANVYQWFESRADRSTRHSETGSRVNRLARRTMSKLLGAESIASCEAVLTGTEAALKRLSREEEISTTIFQINVQVSSANDPAARAELAMFDARVKDAARQLHFGHIDVRASLNKVPDQRSLLFPDRLHYTPRAHRIMADRMLAAFDDGEIVIPD